MHIRDFCVPNADGIVGDDLAHEPRHALRAGCGIAGHDEDGGFLAMAFDEEGYLEFMLLFYQCWVYLACSCWWRPWWLLVLFFVANPLNSPSSTVFCSIK